MYNTKKEENFGILERGKRHLLHYFVVDDEDLSYMIRKPPEKYEEALFHEYLIVDKENLSSNKNKFMG